jgi:hypothetical protein
VRTLVLLLVVLTGLAEAAQSSAPRDRPVSPERAETTASLGGRVLAGDTGRPLRRVTVSLTTGNMQTTRWTVTDDAGAWVFANVTPGAYRLTASRDGYVTWAYGQKGPFGPAATISVVAGDTRERLDIVVPRGGVVTGRIVDDAGEPVGAALVEARRVAFVDGVRQLVPVADGFRPLHYGGLTDDRGEYRIFGLAPGTYFLSATHAPTPTGHSDDRVTYATTFYPGSTSVAAAGPVRVVAGTDASASFGLARVRLVEVSGRVTTSQGAGVRALVGLAPIAPGHAIEGPGRPVEVDSSGTFAVRGVPAGDYVLRATVRSAGVPDEVAAVRLTVGGEDVRNLIVATAATASAAGRLVLDPSSSSRVPSGFFLDSVRMGVVEVGGRVAPSRPIPVGGTFDVAGFVGPHLVRLRNPAPGWWLKAVFINGRETTDVPYTFRPGEVAEMEIVVTDRMASVSGNVRGQDGQPAPDHTVVIFSTDERHWGRGTRHVIASVPDTDGAFAITGLPPGEFAVVAVPPLEAGEQSDPERLSTWLGSARRLTLTDAAVSGVVLTATP